MIIEELKSNGITTLEGVYAYLQELPMNKRGNNEFIPNNLSKLLTTIAQRNNPKSCIILNSNLGEILSHFTGIENKLGIDISAQNIELAKYLNPNLQFENLDPLSYISKTSFDSVICFPPLGQRIEINGYLIKSLELLSEQGSAVFIVSNNFLIASVFEELRNTILFKYGLETIISMPKGILIGTGIELSILVVNHAKIEKTKYYKIKDRAFSKTSPGKPDFSVLRNNLIDRWDYKFHNPKNREYEKEFEIYETKRIEELVDVISGCSFRIKDLNQKGDFLRITSRNISHGNLISTDDDKFLSKIVLSGMFSKYRKEGVLNAMLESGDILVSRILRNNKKSYYVHTDTDKQIIAGVEFIILRGKNADYVATYLHTENGIKFFNQQIEQHAKGMVSMISISDLKNIKIPILPLEDLELASKIKLAKLSYDELLVIEEKYENLKKTYNDSKDSHSQILEIMRQNHNEVMSTMGRIENKVENIKSILTELVSDFNSIKELPREIDERINRLNKSLDSKLDELISDQKQLDSYITEIKRWFDFYDLLEPKSKKYLPEAEYIFDHISKLENPDYSPFILQYCRALENELLKKIFRAYIQSLIDRKIEITKEFGWDFGRKETGKPNSENTLKLVKHIQRCLKKSEDQWFFELGSMQVNLRYLTGKTAKKSPLLIDLESFILNRFEKEILNIEYLDEIKTIIIDYRNQSAHPNLIDAEKAVKFHKEMKKCLIELMENYKE